MHASSPNPFTDLNSSPWERQLGSLKDAWPVTKFQKRKGSGKRKTSMKRLEAEMAEIGEQQKRVKKGQMEIRERFKEMEFECDQLKKETFLISKQAARNQERLNLMFKIVRAREENDISEADKLTQSLRECMKHNMENSP
ncbi:PREDICTED: uncharacterized protein LOC105128189 isoform X2 [Populus euphratica]|uniref:Uncharacterized protein LOC105128189 isoform X2 n=1 Tax=Populus euphratica TaxID=75702 RepID=A0AAJ6XQZ0_POPEU|nr:PREDICTED: uncharacterized protein LOC105128189 isoform X2 [Populus euphratica]